ncbi:hypothetical protein NGRA_3074 [Nosema granulosis]|uniref:Uncharacterized protein n=1 Tax=Nosema granulosis TaxID=83296 RepID=A0A9P6KX40_9MICR|nr:hypothetical protein NGRA_3074 [Nosema granulosis]
MSKKLLVHNSVGSYSTSTVLRIINEMDYLRNTLTLISIDRNSSENKNVRAQTGHLYLTLMAISLFLDVSGFNLHTYQNFGYSPKTRNVTSMYLAGKEQIYSYCVLLIIQGIGAFRIKVVSF